MDSVHRASIRVDTNTENIAGVHLPIFIIKETEDQGTTLKNCEILDSNLNQIGLDRGGQAIKQC